MFKNMEKRSMSSKLLSIVKKGLVLSVFTFMPLAASAQCGIENKAFGDGEFLAYDLYFNWKFVWGKQANHPKSTNCVFC